MWCGQVHLPYIDSSWVCTFIDLQHTPLIFTLDRYQCRFKILQAAQYGVPQSRERLIFWGARRDVHLPEFPLPSHFYAKAGREYKLPTFGTLRPVSRSLDPNVLHSCAALPALTVPDAIGDLVRISSWVICSA